MLESCRRCGRKLRSQNSMKKGYGPICYKKHLREVAEKEFLKIQITIDELLKEGA